MKKLLATAVIAAGLAAVLPASPASAAGGPPAGTPLVCTMEYHSVMGYRWGGGADAVQATFSGTCIGLTTLQTYPVSRGPGHWNGDAGRQCLAPAGLDLLIGGGRYGVSWDPVGGRPTSESSPQVAAGAITGVVGEQLVPLGVGAFVGTESCRPGPGGLDRLDGTMVLTFLAPAPMND